MELLNQSAMTAKKKKNPVQKLDEIYLTKIYIHTTPALSPKG
jgi:hypothetical protein